jgi:hypothetical protein
MKQLVDQPRKAFVLYRKNKRRFTLTLTKRGDQIWVCGECGTIHTPHGYGADKDLDAKQRAVQCCLQRYCECGNKILLGYTGPKCCSCNEMIRNAADLAKAVEIDTCDSPVYDNERQKYYASLDEFMDYLACEMEDREGPEPMESLPDWIFPCTTRKFGGLDASDILQSALDEHHEDAHEQLVDEDGLQKFLDEWSERQTIESWEPDYSRKLCVAKLIEVIERDQAEAKAKKAARPEDSLNAN